MVRKLMSDAEDAVLDLRDLREERWESGTRLQEDAAGLLTRPPPPPPSWAGPAPLPSRGWQRGTRSSVGSSTPGTELGFLGQRRGSVSLAARFSSRCFLRWWWWWWWCRCGGLDDLRSFTHRDGSPEPGGSGPWWFCCSWGLLLPRAAGLLPVSGLSTWDGWHSGLRELRSLSADQEDSSGPGRWWC